MQRTYDKTYEYQEETFPMVALDHAEHVELPSGYEFRIELDFSQAITVTLEDGLAEVFGSELPLGAPIYFSPGSKLAIFTWHWARFTIRGQMHNKYCSESGTMMSYLDTHQTLNEFRHKAHVDKRIGPNLLVCGA